MSNDINLAYVDLLSVGMGGHCGANNRGNCDPALRVTGHCDSGEDVAFLVIFREMDDAVFAHTLGTPVESGYYADGLLSQVADGVLTMSKDNPGPPWKAVEFNIHTGGAGGYSLRQFLSVDKLYRVPEARWKIQAFASPVKMISMPDGHPLRRVCLNEWNWEGGQEVELHVYRQGKVWMCDEDTAGPGTPSKGPVVSPLELDISGDDQHEGYARVIVRFDTDVEAQAQAHFSSLFSEGGVLEGEMAYVCDPYISGLRSGVSEPGLHHELALPMSALWYSQESDKQYCLQVVTWLPRWRYAGWARGKSGVVDFSLPRRES